MDQKPAASKRVMTNLPESAGVRRPESKSISLLVPRDIPHAWTLTDELVVTVGGKLSRAELIGVSESLRTRQ